MILKFNVIVYVHLLIFIYLSAQQQGFFLNDWQLISFQTPAFADTTYHQEEINTAITPAFSQKINGDTVGIALPGYSVACIFVEDKKSTLTKAIGVQ